MAKMPGLALMEEVVTLLIWKSERYIRTCLPPSAYMPICLQCSVPLSASVLFLDLGLLQCQSADVQDSYRGCLHAFENRRHCQRYQEEAGSWSLSSQAAPDWNGRWCGQRADDPRVDVASHFLGQNSTMSRIHYFSVCLWLVLAWKCTWILMVEWFEGFGVQVLKYGCCSSCFGLVLNDSQQLD